MAVSRRERLKLEVEGVSLVDAPLDPLGNWKNNPYLEHYLDLMCYGSTVEGHSEWGRCWETNDGSSRVRQVVRRNVTCEGQITFHRFFWECVYDVELAVDTFLIRKCHNKKCFNPSHLEIMGDGDFMSRHYRERLYCRAGIHRLVGSNAEKKEDGTRLCGACDSGAVETRAIEYRLKQGEEAFRIQESEAFSGESW